MGCAGDWLTQGVVLISVAGPHPSLRVKTSPAPPPMLAASPVWWRRMRQRPQRITTPAWWVQKKIRKQDKRLYVTGLSNIRVLLCVQESLSSAGTPHKRDSFTYTTWLEDSVSSTSTTSRGNSPGERSEVSVRSRATNKSLPHEIDLCIYSSFP